MLIFDVKLYNICYTGNAEYSCVIPQQILSLGQVKHIPLWHSAAFLWGKC